MEILNILLKESICANPIHFEGCHGLSVQNRQTSARITLAESTDIIGKHPTTLQIPRKIPLDVIHPSLPAKVATIVGDANRALVTGLA